MVDESSPSVAGAKRRRRRVPPGDEKVAIAYVRVSTDDQALGLDVQRGAIERWAAGGGVTIASWHTDEDISGGAALEDRPALMASILDISAHRAGIFVVQKRDRLARDVILAATLEGSVRGRGARIVSAAGEGTESDDPGSLLLRRMIDAVAEYERAIIRARIKAALAVKKARGERVGQIPYGWEMGEGKLLRVHPEEQKVIAVVSELRSCGLSLRKIVEHLNRGHIHPREGSRWHLTQIDRIVNRTIPGFRWTCSPPVLTPVCWTWPLPDEPFPRTEEGFHRWYEGKGCSICGCNGRLFLDHDHVTALVRGPLCNTCNVQEGVCLGSNDPARREQSPFREYRERHPAAIFGIEIRHRDKNGRESKPAPWKKRTPTP